jgi:hypothetical protein
MCQYSMRASPPLGPTLAREPEMLDKRRLRVLVKQEALDRSRGLIG